MKPHKRLRDFLSAAAICASLLLASPAQASVSRADFNISFKELTSNLRIISTTALPGEALDIATDGRATAISGRLAQTAGGWQWTAPQEPGLSVVTFSKGGESIRLNVFVLSKWENGVEKDFNGYTIGKYVRDKKRGASYDIPKGFIAAKPELLDVHVSPSFTLGQFLCKQQPGHYPQAVLIRSETLAKLEMLVDKLADMGKSPDSIKIMSGFRTPHYNHAIGNKTDLSRHLYGGAADIYVDDDGDGMMDDLDGDGRITKRDAAKLAEMVEDISVASADRWTPGGLAIYGATASHGPFIHIDSRGYNVQW